MEHDVINNIKKELGEMNTIKEELTNIRIGLEDIKEELIQIKEELIGIKESINEKKIVNEV